MTYDSRLIEPIVRSALAKEPTRRFVAVRSDVLPDAPASFEIDGEEWQAHPVQSTLQARRVLAYAGDEGRRVLITTILEDELGPEVMVRMAQNQVHRVEPWQLVRDAFEANDVDGRVAREAWLATVLLEHRPAGGYARTRSGTLDLETVWVALSKILGFEGGEPGLNDWVAACAEDNFQERWETLGDAFRGGLGKRLREQFGEPGAVLVQLLEAGRAGTVVPLALVAEAIDRSPSGEVRTAAAVRLSMKVGIEGRPAVLASASAQWCEQRLEAGQASALGSVFAQAEEFSSAFDATALLGASDMLPGGALVRLEQLGQAIEAAVGAGASSQARESVEELAERALDHRLMGRYPKLTAAHEQAKAARRLVRWLGTGVDSPDSLAAAASGYRDGGAWVDRLRHRLLQAADSTAWSASLRHLAAAVLERRERETAAFAQVLQRVTGGQEGDGGVLYLESVFREVVAPLANHLPVLVIVLDGMSQAVFQELSESVAKRTSLRRMVEGSARSWPAVISPLPSVTEVARASLLAGELTQGGANTELSGMRSLAQEFGWSKQGAEGLLFHKGKLHQSGGGLSAEVLSAIEGDSKVVTAVVNAIDDQLSKGDQLDLRWALDQFKHLETLIHAAESVRRAVVLTADHGHVVETWESDADAAHHEEKGERWRSPGRAPEERELEFGGPRVMLPAAGGPVVLPWSERLRYCSRHAGYHGGASPQEVVVPLGVFVPENAAAGLQDKGWDDELVVEPWWWTRAEAPSSIAIAAEPKPTRPSRQREPAGQARLFEENQTAASANDDSFAPWIPDLFASEVYKGQLRAAKALRPKEEAIAAFLTELDQLGGQATHDGLRKRLELSSIRFSSLLRLVARLLNVDGYEVLGINEAERTVRLDRVRLEQQFGIGGLS